MNKNFLNFIFLKYSRDLYPLIRAFQFNFNDSPRKLKKKVVQKFLKLSFAIMNIKVFYLNVNVIPTRISDNIVKINISINIHWTNVCVYSYFIFS